jgi:demethylmenaquinone methyltransferase/2-methoxy-6-polyprenyl-1,4-benzoquinol methylase
VAYYRARAAEYDDWWERRNDFDDGPEFASAWEADIEQLRGWLQAFGPLGRVLELAAGTGNWTRELVGQADSLTAVDASPEVLRVNAAKLAAQGGEVKYVVADLFGWQPTGRYDTIFFGFWLSHVPRNRWQSFWATLTSALAPDGVVLFCDNAAPLRAASRGPARERAREVNAAPGSDDQEIRSLRDGTTFEIVKRYWTPDRLVDELASIGWAGSCAETSFAFVYGSAVPRI